MLKTGSSHYIKVLLWAYEQAEKGFTREDLQIAFNLDNAQLEWVLKDFMPINKSDWLIGSYSNLKMDTLALTGKGMSEAVRYLELQEAKEDGRRAEKIAIIAVIIGIVVGIVEIMIGLLQLSSN